MRRLLPLVLLLAGCSSPAPDATSATDTKPVATAATVTTPPVGPVKVEGNPSRVNQLKDLKKEDVDIKGHPVHLWIMDDEGKQAEGMMFLTDKEVKADEGMLFAFDKVQTKLRSDGEPSGFWMHNTLIPLDIVYFSPKGVVVNIAHGKVQDDTGLPAGADYKNVIELKAGTAARFGLKKGDSVTFPKL